MTVAGGYTWAGSAMAAAERVAGFFASSAVNTSMSIVAEHRLAAVVPGLLLPARGTFAADPQLAAYSETIRPLLAERCFARHGGLEQEAGMRLDTVPLTSCRGRRARLRVSPSCTTRPLDSILRGSTWCGRS